MSQLNKLIHDLGYEVEKLVSSIDNDKKEISELDKNIRNFSNQSNEIIEYNKKKEADIAKLEAILSQNLNRNNQLNGTTFLYDQRIAVLEETNSDIKKKFIKIKENNFLNLNNYSNASNFIKSKLDENLLYAFNQSFERHFNKFDAGVGNKSSIDVADQLYINSPEPIGNIDNEQSVDLDDSLITRSILDLIYSKVEDPLIKTREAFQNSNVKQFPNDILVISPEM